MKTMKTIPIFYSSAVFPSFIYPRLNLILRIYKKTFLNFITNLFGNFFFLDQTFPFLSAIVINFDFDFIRGHKTLAQRRLHACEIYVIFMYDFSPFSDSYQAPLINTFYLYRNFVMDFQNFTSVL